MITIGYCQNDPLFGNKQANFKQIDLLCRNFTADLLVLPELFATGYTFTSQNEASSLAETIHGETASFLINLAHSIQGIVVAGFVEKNADQLYNSAMLVDSNHVIGVYRKIHLFNKEKDWFSPGNYGFKVWEISGFKVGVMICFDWIFPESARSLTLQGASVIAHPANLVLPYCQSAMTTRCLENHVYAVTANRIGKETRGDDSFQFTGQSQITNVDGAILSHASMEKIGVQKVTIDPFLARNKNLNAYNNLLDDRRPNFYTT